MVLSLLLTLAVQPAEPVERAASDAVLSVPAPADDIERAPAEVAAEPERAPAIVAPAAAVLSSRTTPCGDVARTRRGAPPASTTVQSTARGTRTSRASGT